MSTFLFVCPINAQVRLWLSEEHKDKLRHCETGLQNSQCPFIALGCNGCKINLDFIRPYKIEKLKAMPAISEEQLNTVRAQVEELILKIKATKNGNQH